jgi:hypothetical protein
MFLALQLEVMERFTAAKEHFRATRGFNGEPRQIAKGLAFVQVYAIYEFTVSSVVRLAVQGVASHSHKWGELRPSLLALFLDPQLESLKMCGAKYVWEKRLEIFKTASSNGRASVSSDPLPVDGSHFRHAQLELIFRVFGVSRKPTRRPRHMFRIDEVVNNRNAIAHGGETAGAVGRRYSRKDIAAVTRQMESVCLRLIEVFSDYCSKPAKHRK